MPTPPIASPAVWLRSDLGITIGTGVSTWADQSGSGNNATQSTGADQPSYNTSDPAYGGQATLGFNGAQFLQLASLLPNPPCTVYIICQANSAGQFQQFPLADSGATGPIILWGGPSSVQWGMYIGGYVHSPVTTTNVPQILGGVFGASSSALYINSATSPSVTGGVTGNPSGTEYVGMLAGYYLDGKVAEILVYSGAHTSAQVTTVFAYFINRYLPQNDPIFFSNEC